MQIQNITTQQTFKGRAFNMVSREDKALRGIVENVKPKLDKILKTKDYNVAFFHSGCNDKIEVVTADNTYSGGKPASALLFKNLDKIDEEKLMESANSTIAEYKKINQYDTLKNKIKRTLYKIKENLGL